MRWTPRSPRRSRRSSSSVSTRPSRIRPEPSTNSRSRPMPDLEYRVAIRDAIDEELTRDETVIFYGEDVAVAGGVFAATPGLMEKHGRERVFDTPISELAITGSAFGAAVTGLRPIIEIMFGDFLYLAMDSLLNQSAKFFFISNEQGSVPLVVRSA